jgi:hypothetical protein
MTVMIFKEFPAHTGAGEGYPDGSGDFVEFDIESFQKGCGEIFQAFLASVVQASQSEILRPERFEVIALERLFSDFFIGFTNSRNNHNYHTKNQSGHKPN